MAKRRTKDAADRPYPWEPMLETSVFDPWWERTLKGGASTLIPSTPRETANELFLSALPLGPVLSKLASKVGPPTRRAVQRFVNPPFESSRREALRNIGGPKTGEQIAKRTEVFGTSRPPMDTDMTGLDEIIQGQLGGKNLSLAELADQGGFLAREVQRVIPWRGPRFASKEVPFRPEYIDFGQVSGRYEKELLKDIPTELAWGPSGEIIGVHGPTVSALENIGRRYSQDIPITGGIFGDVIEHGKRLSREIMEGVAEETGEVIQKEAPGAETKAFLDRLLRRLGVPREEP